VTGSVGLSCPDLGDFAPPTLETLPDAVARNVAIARARTRARIMAVVKADGYGHGACTVAQAAVAAGAE
jgi:alanine racemase